MAKTQLELNQVPITQQTTFYKTIGIKKVLICFHGFETTKTHDITAFKQYFESVNVSGEFEVALVNLYDYGNKKTYRHKTMLLRAENACREYLNRGYMVYILAYSFSAGIAARCCTDFPQIEKLTLISPTIYVLKTKLLSGYCKLLGKRLKFKAKYKKKAAKMIARDHSAGITKLLINILIATVKYRKYLKSLRCKVFMVKGNNDEVCITNTFSYISKKSKNTITMSKVYPNEDHMMIISKEHGKMVYDDVLRFNFHIEKGDDFNADSD